MARWTAEKASSWYARQPWLVGCNFIPSSAVNQLEMWQADTFDPETIDRELSWAADTGFNTVRTYLHDLAWEVDAAGFKERIDQFLTVAAKHGIRPMLVIFDDCWNPAPYAGKQPGPLPGVHNSGWWQSPGVDVVDDPQSWNRLERYVQDILDSFSSDNRILAWDLYNEPGNSKIRSFALVEAVLRWAREVAPSQPLTIGLWNFAHKFRQLNELQRELSDIITFHHYRPAADLQKLIARLQAYGRPLICTEWMARSAGSQVATNLPVFQENNVGCINWGLVAGKTNTIYPWKDSWPGIKRRIRALIDHSRPSDAEPEVWFHDLFRPDGTPFDEAEISLFKSSRLSQSAEI